MTFADDLRKVEKALSDTIKLLDSAQQDRPLRGHYRVEGRENGKDGYGNLFTVECRPEKDGYVRLYIYVRGLSTSVVLSAAQANKLGQGLIVAVNASTYPNQREVS